MLDSVTIITVESGPGGVLHEQTIIVRFPSPDESGGQVHHPKRPTQVMFGVPYLSHLSHPNTRKPMSINIPNDAIAAVPLVFKDDRDNTLAGHPDNGQVAIDDETLAKIALTVDGQWVQITPLKAEGTGKITYTDTADSITATLDFSIVVPNPTAASFNETATVLTKNPNPPAGAAGGPPATDPTPTPDPTTTTSAPTPTDGTPIGTPSTDAPPTP